MNLKDNERVRKFQFGKIALWPSSRRSNLVEVEIYLRKLDNEEYEFSSMGKVWNCRHTDIISGGQNLDKISKFVRDPVFREIYDLWKKYHLNGMNSGTLRQETALKEETQRRNEKHREKGEKLENPLTYADRYDDACEYLKSIGLYIDKLTDGEVLNYEDEKKGVTSAHYPYGHGWITRTLTDKALKRINSLLDSGEVYKED